MSYLLRTSNHTALSSAKNSAINLYSFSNLAKNGTITQYHNPNLLFLSNHRFVVFLAMLLHKNSELQSIVI